MDNNIGLCAAYFSQENKYIRWPILSSWKEAGERVLVGLTGADASSAPMGPPRTQEAHDAITIQLCRTVADAANRIDTQTMTSHSYALMEHLGDTCFVIDADTLTVSPMATRPWIEADHEIDRRDRENTKLIARVRRRGNRMTMAWPIAPSKP
jgi:hypothetical protein